MRRKLCLTLALLLLFSTLFSVYGTTAEAASNYYKMNSFAMNAKLKVSQTKKQINVAWGKVKDADYYEIHLTYCGLSFSGKTTKVHRTGKTSAVIKRLGGKPISLTRNFKLFVAAYDSSGTRVGRSIIAHIVGRKNTAYTNIKQVKVAQSSYTLSVGDTAKIEAEYVLVDSSKKMLSRAHARTFRYASSDTSVATVAGGTIKAVGSGTCQVYVYAKNGYAKKITVKVK